MIGAFRKAFDFGIHHFGAVGCADKVYGYGKYHVLSCQVRILIAFREGQVQIYGIANIDTD